VKRKSLSQVKNLMRRALKDLVDPPASESEQNRLRVHFHNECAYCGAPAGPRQGHIDHAEPGEGNSAGNLLLACAVCNGDEKREMGWEAFLMAKCGGDAEKLNERRARILDWRHQHPRVPKQTLPEVAEAMTLAEDSIRAFEEAYNRLRCAVKQRSPGPEPHRRQ
jgi:hypothetical protein